MRSSPGVLSFLRAFSCLLDAGLKTIRKNINNNTVKRVKLFTDPSNKRKKPFVSSDFIL
jgi:hypothetical protein